MQWPNGLRGFTA